MSDTEVGSKGDSDYARDAAIANLIGDIDELENKLKNAKERLLDLQTVKLPGATELLPLQTLQADKRPLFCSFPPFPPLFTRSSLACDFSHHNLLLLSDSALPLGSFAYSSGLESYIAHHHYYYKSRRGSDQTIALSIFRPFLYLSLESVTSFAVPYVLAASRSPSRLVELDNDFDASTLCAVARRSSLSQGRALLTIWRKALRYSSSARPDSTHRTDDGKHATSVTATECLISFSSLLNNAESSSDSTTNPSSNSDWETVNGHFAPLWGTVCTSLSLPTHQTAYLFLLNHAKMICSAAVRAGLVGPYQAQYILAGPELQVFLAEECLKRIWDRQVEDAEQVVPMMDLWMGRHELLYTRIFNS